MPRLGRTDTFRFGGAQLIGNQARHVTTPHEQETFVRDFCRSLQTVDAYRTARVALAVEANNNRVDAHHIYSQFKKYLTSDMWPLGMAEITNTGITVLTEAEEHEKTLLAGKPGLWTGVSLLSKYLYAKNLQTTIRNKRLRIAKHLIGVDAENVIQDALKEIQALKMYKRETQQDQMLYAPPKYAISGKKGGTAQDDLAIANAMLITTILATTNTPNSAIRMRCQRLCVRLAVA
jgi:hypothetical protein